MSDTADPPPPPGEPPKETSVEIHKPKAVHNWREFLKEYAIIVLGVATALAAEQAVEWLHWQGEVKAARQAIFAEMADNNGRFFARRIAITSCLDRQLDEADAILSALEEKRPPGRFTNFRTGSGSLIVDSEWQAQRASQVLTHFSHSELAVMGSYYAMIPTFDDWVNQESNAWSDLSVLRKPLAGIAVSDLLHLRARLDTARLMQGRIIQNAQLQLDRSRQIGVPQSRYDPAGVRQFCTLSIDDVLRNVRKNIAN